MSASQQPAMRFQYGGKAVSEKLAEPFFKDIGKFSAVADIPILLFAILTVDVAVLFLSRYTGYFGKALNRWYDEFGLSAVIADVFIILIGFLIARYIWTEFFQERYGWNFLYFMSLVVLVQLLHDLFFFLAVIKPLAPGHNDMIDVFKAYADEAGGKILLGDAGLMLASGVLAAWAKGWPTEWTVSAGSLVTYALPYILYTGAKA